MIYQSQISQQYRLIVSADTCMIVRWSCAPSSLQHVYSPFSGSAAPVGGRVYSSVRRLTNSCYSLILDDDNKQLDDRQKENSPISVKSSVKNKQTAKKTSKKSAEGGSKGTGSDDDKDSFVLDACMFCNVLEDGWNETWGGSTTYVAKNEEKEVTSFTQFYFMNN